MALIEFEDLPNTTTPITADNLNNNFDELNNNFNEVNNKFNYSITETIIGKWVDGNDIYRAIYQGNIANGVTLFSNVNAIINLSGYGFLGNNTRKVILNGVAGDAPSTLFSAFFAENNTIEFYAKYGGTTTTAYNCSIILEYTKTS